MDLLQFLCVVSVAFTGLTSGAGVLPDGPLAAAVGGTVMFTTTQTPPEKPFLVVSWSFINKNTEKTIVTSTSSNLTSEEYEGRITLFRSTGSLELRNVALNDSGEYRVSIVPDGSLQITGQTRLEILVSVANVMVTVSDADLMEFSSSVSLSCSSSGSSLSFLWMNRSSEVTASERVQLTDGNTTITIINVTRYDQGPFRCRVSNAVSNGTSDPVNISISYGPENINLKTSPSQEHYLKGSNIDLSCSADSNPSPIFNWILNGDLLSETGPELRLMNVQESQSGNYSCQAFNNKTLKYQTSQSSAVVVIVPISNITVTLSDADLVEFSSSVSLSCSSSGSSLSFLWLNSSSEVTASESVQHSDGASTITIINVTRYDQGPFRCYVFNPVSNGTSDPVNLSISFGPDDINLKKSPSQENYVKGSDIVLSCSAVSNPSAQFNWFLNDELLSDTGTELSLKNIQTSHSGNYSCQAFNSKTLRYQKSQPSAVTVLEKQTPGACSAGCIAGIVIACLVIAVICAVLLYYICKKKKQKKLLSKRDAATRTGGEGQDNAAFSQSRELNYAQISFHNRNGGTIQLGVENNSTQYAEIQVNRPKAASSPPTYDAHMQRIKVQVPQPGASGAQTYAQVRKK